MITPLILTIESFFCGFLGAWSGAEKTSLLWRRILIPLIIMVNAFFISKSFFVIFIMALAGVYSIGYGVPTPDDKDPSMLGGMYYKAFNKDHKKTELAIRLHIAFLKCIPFIPIIFLSKKVIPFIIMASALIFFNLLFACFIKKEGVFKIKLPWSKEKELLLEEFYIYLTESLSMLFYIYFSFKIVPN